MKKIILTILLISTVLLCLALCGGTSGIAGTYVCEDRRPPIAGGVNKITFDGNTCAITEGSFLYDNLSYTIENEQLHITGIADFGFAKTEIDYTYSFRQEADCIYLDEVEFVKQ